MKRIALILLFIGIVTACDIDINIESGSLPDESALDRELIYGTWKITHAKYSEDAKLTAWEHEDTYAVFKENGIYKGEGYWGSSEGTYSISGNTITAYIDNEPYMRYEVIAITESGDQEDIDINAEIKITLLSSRKTIWTNCLRVELLDLTPGTSNQEESFIINEEAAMTAIDGLYGKVREFSLYQHYIEYLALTDQRESLGKNSQLIHDAWLSAYTSISSMNNIIEVLETHDDSWTPKYAWHAKALRAFVYYNLTVLWGDVPYVAAGTDVLLHPRTKADEIITNELSALETICPSFEQLSSTSSGLSQGSCRMLLAEIYLFKGDRINAKNALKNAASPHFTIPLTSYVESPSSYFEIYGKEIWGDNAEITIYDVQLLDLYAAEINCQLPDIASSWNRSQYGKWAMLKRLGKAQEITGCKDFELLMPIPDKEMLYNPLLTQNEGYY